VPWPYWLFVGLMIAFILVLGVLAIVDEIRMRDHDRDDDWRDDNTGWG
jgi:hypothetical protein